ncbi:hypothetical protein FLJU110815_15870 [Flavobacterium jumunjinense]
MIELKAKTEEEINIVASLPFGLYVLSINDEKNVRFIDSFFVVFYLFKVKCPLNSFPFSLVTKNQ